jgi:hypothetical protein
MSRRADKGGSRDRGDRGGMERGYMRIGGVAKIGERILIAIERVVALFSEG